MTFHDKVKTGRQARPTEGLPVFLLLSSFCLENFQGNFNYMDYVYFLVSNVFFPQHLMFGLM